MNDVAPQDDHESRPANSLGIRPGARVWIGGHDAVTRRRIEPLLVETQRPPIGPLDGIIITPASSDEAVYFAEKHAPRLTPDGFIVVIFPTIGIKDSSGRIQELSQLIMHLAHHGLLVIQQSSLDSELTILALELLV